MLVGNDTLNGGGSPNAADYLFGSTGADIFVVADLGGANVIQDLNRFEGDVIGLPDGQSCLNLAAARLRYVAGSAWSTKRYMNMRPLSQPQIMQTGAVA